jgi:hypothetical protein
VGELRELEAALEQKQELITALQVREGGREASSQACSLSMGGGSCALLLHPILKARPCASTWHLHTFHSKRGCATLCRRRATLGAQS